MPAQSNIGRAIQELETERTHLQARIGKVDHAIATMRELFHLPGVVSSAGPMPRRKPTPANGNGHDSEAAAKIRAVLTAGPMSPRELSSRLGIDRGTLRRPLKQLEQEGAIVATGSTVARRFALPGKPAKEAP